MLGNLPLAQFSGTAGLVALVVGGMILFFLWTASILKYYKRCPSNRILVIFGKTDHGKGTVCIRGGARMVMPLVQDYAWLSLEPMQVEIPLSSVPSADKIRVDVRIVLTVAIGTSPELMDHAAARLLGLSFVEITKIVTDLATGQFRHVIASMRVEEIVHDRPRFLELVDQWLPRDLEKLGMTVINVTVTDIDAEQGYLDTLGRKAVADAAIQKLIEDRFDGSAAGLIAQLIEDGRFMEADRTEIRRLLDVPRE